LEIEASDPLRRPLWYNVFSSDEDVIFDVGELRYRPTAGPQTITTFAINPDSGAQGSEFQPGPEHRPRE
jgi:hypothetical protein